MFMYRLFPISHKYILQIIIFQIYVIYVLTKYENAPTHVHTGKFNIYIIFYYFNFNKLIKY